MKRHTGAISTGTSSEKCGHSHTRQEKLCPASLLQSCVLIPGRILHVRIPIHASGNKAVDVIGVYQHAWNTTVPRAEMLSRREKLLLGLFSPCQTVSVLSTFS